MGSIGTLMQDHLDFTLILAGAIATGITYAVSRDKRTTTLVALCAGVIWVFGNTLAILPGIWEEQPQYSHGYLV
ncbi:MAG: hypothetical protein JNG90_01460, partial [Planctomycetaceae bacterium]|nr:hypothetical protein [Planctomycetaceae bacterium]